MARTEDLPEQLRHGIADLECPRFEQTPFVMGPPLAQRRVALVNSAAMIERGGQPFRVDVANGGRSPGRHRRMIC